MKLPSFLRRKPEDPEVKAAYEAAYRKGKLKRAEEEGYKAGKTKPKSLLNKIGSFGEGVSKEFGNFGASGGSSYDFDDFLFGETKKKTKKKKRTRVKW